MKENWISNSNQDKNIERSILLGRGITNYEKFISPTLDKLNNPLLLADGEKAAKRIISAVENNKKIIIFGHDDVDGVTSTVILYKCLTKLGSENHNYYIPNREYERYGIQDVFKNKVLRDEAKLIITVDIGINDIEAIDFFNKYNIDTIVLDHHIIFRELPKAFAVVNPKRNDCSFPFNMLAGVGVVYNIVKIIEKLRDISFDPLYTFLTGLGSLADRVPLIDDNRIFASACIRSIESQSRNLLINNTKNTENLFIRYYIEDNKNLTKHQMINKLLILLTIGRDKNGLHLGVEALLSKSLYEVKEIYNKLQERLEINSVETKEIIKFIDKKFNDKDYNHIFVYWDKSNRIPVKFIGFAASYISDKYKIPSLVLTSRDINILSAESRGPDGFDWVKSFNKISKHLIQFGGHKKAAGFTCYDNEYENIERELKKIAKSNSNTSQNMNYMKHKIYIDYQLSKENFNIKFLKKITSSFLPFGEKNQQPIFLIKNVSRTELKSSNILNIPNLNDNEMANILISYNDNIQDKINIIDYEIVN